MSHKGCKMSFVKGEKEMSEILIKGMEMPKYCRSCRFEFSSIHGPQCRITRKFTRLNDNEEGMKKHISCPLVEVPTHGDLIDKIKLREHAYVIQMRDRISFQDALTLALRDAPIIIEASEERE